MLATHLHPVLGLRMNEMYLYCPIELYGMHGDNLTSAVRMHTITSHPQLFACTPLPHTLSCLHAHHYLTPSAVRMHTITSHPQLFTCTPLPHTLSCSHAHHYLTPSAVRMHTITSHPQLFACTPLPHTISCWHAHHYLTPSAVGMHTITSHLIHLRPILNHVFFLRHFRLQICTCPLYFLTEILPALYLTSVYIQKFLYFF